MKKITQSFIAWLGRITPVWLKRIWRSTVQGLTWLGWAFFALLIPPFKTPILQSLPRWFEPKLIARARNDDEGAYPLLGQVNLLLLYRWRQHFSLSKWLLRQRWLWLLAAALLTHGLAYHLIKGWALIPQADSVDLNTLLKNPNGWQVLLTLFGVVILFVIWLFRDQNARWQIENNRKDINLKDFQKLAEWASGLHLPENKITVTEKTTPPKAGSPSSAESTEPPQPEQLEHSTSTESYTAPNSELDTTSRREGAVSLQIAAVAQLEGFLSGEYGAQFQRPAFQLLKSVWLALMQPETDTLADWIKQPDSKARTVAIANWRAGIAQKATWPLAVVITRALLADHGRALRHHGSDLPDILLAGINSQLPALPQPLELCKLKLSNSQWQGADLRGADLRLSTLTLAKLQGAKLQWTKLQGAELQGAELQGAYLQSAELQGTNLQLANLQGTYLQGVKLQRANLQGANLQGAELQRANLQGAELQDAGLQGAKLQRANLQGAHLEGATLQGELNEHTDFTGMTVDPDTVLEVWREKPEAKPWQPARARFAYDKAATLALHAKLAQQKIQPAPPKGVWRDDD